MNRLRVAPGLRSAPRHAHLELTQEGDAHGNRVAVGDDRFDRHLQVWELAPQPFDRLACV
jgi:hypothetical protein